MRKLVALVAVASLFAWSSPAQGQVSPYRDGWWGSFNFGPGWNSSDNLEGERLTGGAGALRGGYALSPNWLVGGEVMGWYRDYLSETLNRWNFSGTLLVYPGQTSGFFFKGGVGLASVTYSPVGGGTESDSGLGWDLGLGYDIRIGRTIFLTVAADWYFQDVPSLDTTNQLALLTLGLTWF